MVEGHRSWRDDFRFASILDNKILDKDETSDEEAPVTILEKKKRWRRLVPRIRMKFTMIEATNLNDDDPLCRFRPMG